ncbi:hypothetical protein KTI09_17855, partial [Acinetobacter pittii]|nr:hypothetical protein [Acinetobacter pittii]
MKTFLVISLLGFGLIGCASSPYNSQENYLNKPPIVGEFKHEVRQFQKPYDNQQAEQISLM